MERNRGPKLMLINTTYLKQFSDSINNEQYMKIRLEESELSRLIVEQLPPEEADIVARHLIGQSSFDIAEQMKLDRLVVEAILAEAPCRIIYTIPNA